MGYRGEHSYNWSAYPKNMGTVGEEGNEGGRVLVGRARHMELPGECLLSCKPSKTISVLAHSPI